MRKLRKYLRWLNFPNLNLYLVTIFLIGLIMNNIEPLYYHFNLSLDVQKILQGQIWRLVTFLFHPPTIGSSIIIALLMIFVYHSITKTLVMMWGNFKFNLYILIGIISQIIGAFIVYFVTGYNTILYPTYMTFSIFIAFALSFPEAVFMIYFLIPVKARYFAYFEIFIYGFQFVFSSLPDKIAIVCSVVNLIIYFVLLKDKI